MAVQTRPPRDAGARTPDRLPRGAAQAARGREVRLGVLGLLGLAVLLVGIPVALCLFVGYPLPRTAPSKDWLTTSISSTLIIKILACVVWVLWAHFLVCVLSEWRAVRRGRLPGHVLLGGGSQLLARRLVAAALLLSGAATVYTQSGLGAGSAPAPVVASQHAATTRTEATDAGSRADAVAEGAGQGRHQAQAETKYYVVQPPHGRRYDSLWDIAERTLRDPLRYKEIFALNKDRIQADGRKLVDANLIMPGWQLRLPADASGPGVTEARVSRPAAPEPAPAVPSVNPVGDPQPGRHETAGATVGAPVSTATAGGSSSSAHGSLGYTLFGGGLVLAGLVTALTARRGPYAPVDQDDALVGADPALAGLLDKALRTLAAARSEQGRALPQPIIGWAAPDRILLTFSGGDITEPPAPWRAGEDGRSWDLQTAELPDGPAPDVAAPYPGLLSVGRSDGFELFLDVERAPGVISLAGDLRCGRDLLLALAVQAVTCRWSDGAKITAVGFGGENLVEIAPRSITQVPRLADVLGDLEREHADVVDLQRQLGVDGVLSGRQALRSDTWQPRIVLLSGPPTPDEAARLQALSNGRSSTAVLVLGDVPSAPWRFTLDDAGTLDLGALGVSAAAHRLTHQAASELVAMFIRADAERPRRSAEVSGLAPAAVASASPRLRRPDVPAIATVRLLGPVTVEAAGPMDPHRRALATEIVVAAALHPDGLHDAVLRASIWPRGVSEDVFAATMASVGGWLGADASGRPALVQDGDGTWRLGPAVRVDWHDLQAFAASAAGERELDTLGAAVRLIGGEAFSATPAGRYGWLAFVRSAREARVLGTAVSRRAASLLVQAQRRDDALAVLRRGLELVPTAEPLWRDVLTLTSWDGPDGAAAVAAEVYTVLRAHRIWPEAETDALIAQVAPGFDGGPTPSAPAVAAG